MPRVVAYPTPNPDSLKFMAEPSAGEAGEVAFIGSGMAAFRSSGEAAGDTLGTALFGIAGVSAVLVLPSFVTVTKRPEADWRSLASAIEVVLNEHLARAAGRPAG